VDIVRDRNEVVNLARQGLIHKQYNCVLVDTHEDGLEFMRTVRAREVTSGEKHLPVVLLVAHGLEGWEEKYRREGMDNFLLKPCTKEVLMSCIVDAVTAANAIVSNSDRSLTSNSVLSEPRRIRNWWVLL
jgi:CheY-like chemotaxis protein